VDLFNQTKPLSTLPSYGTQSAFYLIQHDGPATYVYYSTITDLTNEYICTDVQETVHVILFEQS
jgi:hypothetical protein